MGADTATQPYVTPPLDALHRFMHTSVNGSHWRPCGNFATVESQPSVFLRIKTNKAFLFFPTTNFDVDVLGLPATRRHHVRQTPA